MYAADFKIFKVRMMDVMGHEIAEFGFYEEFEDADKRRKEVSLMVSTPGLLEIYEIDVQVSSKTLANQGKYIKAESNKVHYYMKDLYDFKE